MNYEDDVTIDETALDVEWLDQPNRMRKYCALAAEARRAMDLAEERREYVKADLSRRVRESPDKFGIIVGPRGGIEEQVKAAVQVHDEYQAAVKAYVDAKYEYEVVRGVVTSFEHRKASLEGLGYLHGQSYFAGPHVPRNLSEERERRDREAQRLIARGKAIWTAERGNVADQPLRRRSPRVG